MEYNKIPKVVYNPRPWFQHTNNHEFCSKLTFSERKVTKLQPILKRPEDDITRKNHSQADAGRKKNLASCLDSKLDCDNHLNGYSKLSVLPKIKISNALDDMFVEKLSYTQEPVKERRNSFPHHDSGNLNGNNQDIRMVRFNPKPQIILFQKPKKPKRKGQKKKKTKGQHKSKYREYSFLPSLSPNCSRVSRTMKLNLSPVEREMKLEKDRRNPENGSKETEWYRYHFTQDKTCPVRVYVSYRDKLKPVCKSDRK